MRNPIRSWISVAVACLCASASSAWAADPTLDPGVVAAEASDVRDRYCTAAAGAEITQQAQGTAAVSAVWARVSQSYDVHRVAYLLYWRALLGQCIDKMDLVSVDLQAFVAAVGDNPAYTEQVRDAERLLRRIETLGQRSAGADPRAGIALGAGVAAGGGVLGALSAWQGQEMRTASDLYYSGTLTTGGFPDVVDAAQAAEATSNGLLAASIGVGAAGLTVLGISAALTAHRSGIAAVVVPTPGGLALSIGGRW